VIARLRHALGIGFALALLAITLASCATCEASGNNSRQSGRCGLFQNF